MAGAEPAQAIRALWFLNVNKYYFTRLSFGGGHGSRIQLFYGY